MINGGPTTVNPIIWMSQSLRPILPQVSLALTSTVLAVFGSNINGWFRALIKDRAFIFRVAAFVLLAAFGYGALNVGLSHLLSRVLMRTDDLWLSPVVVFAFIGIGVIAEEKRQI